ncbi:TIM barrel protein [Acidiphilium sp. PA]|uniref:2-oxo-tetronate isomerase n=1 Tax=Acidiphilium sp. PA TaxID=2871705 RepID=UPI002243F3A3|nr:2-oxo-tetronate isomerase [Acidiphilium sp. PA]MCW8305834.1 TIM barrel protein [Acidiphilium sp. PA]
MVRFAANLTMMFTEHEFLDRFAAAADAGFDAVEFLFPYEHPPEAIGTRLARHGLTQALFNLPPGNWAAGERGLASLPGRIDELIDGTARALEYAAATGVTRLHLMAGIGDRHDPAAMARYRDALVRTAETLAAHGIDLLLEPINGRDMPGYFLNDIDAAAAMIAELGIGNVRLQFDMYHCQIMHGDITMRLRNYIKMIGHVQVASVPSRNEPDGEEVNYPFLFDELDRLGYAGIVGCEYRPRGATRAGLGWFESLRR